MLTHKSVTITVSGIEEVMQGGQFRNMVVSVLNNINDGLESGEAIHGAEAKVSWQTKTTMVLMEITEDFEQ